MWRQALALFVLLGASTAPLNAQDNVSSLRFFGHGVNFIDRVEIKINAPAKPADIGSGDFTIEFWMKANTADNGAGNCAPGADNWITGNILIDRDIYGTGDYGDFGVALFSDSLAFGVAGGGSGSGLCGTTDVADGQWHHIAATRDASTGDITLWVDGQLDGSENGPTGDMSYRDNRSSPHPKDPYLVLGAEKHDAGAAYPSYSGWLDELRLSNTVRYTANFSPPSTVFTPDVDTAALYHFDEEPAGACTGTILDSSTAVGGPSNGSCRFGGSGTAGPVYSSDLPPLAGPPCGDGDLDAGEECDDGNLIDGDDCDSNCTETACGNGIPTSGEACDDGNAATGDGCEPDCTLSDYALLSGKNLQVRDKGGAPEQRKFTVLSRDPTLIVPVPGSQGDPTQHGVVLQWGRGIAEVDTYLLPASGWKGIGTPAGAAGYRYADATRRHGPCQSAVLKAGNLSVSCSGTQINFSLNESSQGALAVSFAPGTGIRSCLVFGGTVSKDTPATLGTVGQFVATNAPTPSSCPLP